MFGKITRWTLSVGLNDKDAKKQLMTDDEALAIINQAMYNVGVDGNIQVSFGIYTHDDGTKVFEKSFNIEILFSSDAKVLELIQVLTVKLNQESIVMKKDKIKSKLVYGRA